MYRQPTCWPAINPQRSLKNCCMGENKQPQPLNYETLKRLNSAPSLSVGIPTKPATAAARRRQSKVTKPGTTRSSRNACGVSCLAQRQKTRQTNKQAKKKVQTLNHGWTQSVSFAAPESIFGMEGKGKPFLCLPPIQKPKARSFVRWCPH